MMEHIKLLLINSGIVVGLTFSNLEMALKISVLIATLGYTIYKWISDYKKNKRDQDYKF